MKRVPLKRGKPLARSGYLKRGPIKRTTRIKLRSGKVSKRFAKRRDGADFAEFVRSQPCCVSTHATRKPDILICYYPGSVRRSEADHLKTRGAGGNDRGNLTPLCSNHHSERHTIGVRSFQAKYGLKLAAVAASLENLFAAGHPEHAGGA